MNRSLVIFLVLAACVAGLLRIPFLEERPMHNDEAVNGVKFGRLWERGQYKYDANEHHGPSLYYAALALGKLTAAPDLEHYSDSRLRAVTIIFGIGVLLLLALVPDAMGRAGTIWAAFFTAVSPAMVFYSRYFIHEMLLVFFTLLALGAGWRYWRSRKPGWILLAGAAIGLMDGTKETFVITLAAAAIAVGLNQTWNRLIDASGAPVKASPLNPWHVVVGLVAWIAVAVVLFSSFFTNASGPLDSLRSYLPWLQRAGGESPHVYPWHFYLHRLLWFHPSKSPVWTEGLLLLLAVIGATAGFRRRQLDGANPSFVRFVTFYAFVLTGFYSFLPYKTPWCLLNFWQPIILLAGIGAAALVGAVKMRPVRIGLILALTAGAGHLSWQAWQTNTEYAADPRNPYVYAQTSPDILDLVSTVQRVGKAAPQGFETPIAVVSPEDDYWPLPWYLRQFRNSGWTNNLPDDLRPPILILSPRIPFRYDETKVHLMGFYGLRPQVPLVLFVENDLWQKWAAQQQRPSAAP